MSLFNQRVMSSQAPAELTDQRQQSLLAASPIEALELKSLRLVPTEPLAVLTNPFAAKETSAVKNRTDNASSALEFMQTSAEALNSAVSLGSVSLGALGSLSNPEGGALAGLDARNRAALKEELKRFPAPSDQQKLIAATGNPEELVQLLASGAIDHLVAASSGDGLSNRNRSSQAVGEAKTELQQRDGLMVISSDNS